MRSTITSLSHGSAIRTPPTLRCSAVTPPAPRALMWSTNAGGNDSSIPYSTPIFAIQPPSKEELLCHFVPPRPIVAEPLPHVHDVRNSPAAQHVRQFHILVELRVLVAGGQHVRSEERRVG